LANIDFLPRTDCGQDYPSPRAVRQSGSAASLGDGRIEKTPKREETMRFAAALLLSFFCAIGSAGAADRPLKVGVLLELSGAFGTTGQLALHGYQYYVQKAGNKLGGRPVETIIEDSAGDPSTAISKAKKLVEHDNVDVLVGPINSATGAALKPYVVEQKIPHLIGSTVAEVLDGHYMFRTSFDGNAEAYLEGYLPGKAGYKKAVLLAPNYLAGQVAEQYFEKGFNDAGGTVVQKLLPRVGAPDYGSFIGQISSEADCAIVFFPGVDAVRFLKQYADYGIKLPLFGFTVTVDETVLPAEGDAALGFIGASQYFSTLDIPENKAFLTEWNAAHSSAPEKPSWLTLSGWLSAAILDKAVAAVHGELSDREAFLKAIQETKLSTPAGPFRFDEKHNPILPRYVMQIRQVDGQPQPVVIATIPEFIPEEAPPQLPPGFVLPGKK
jgi:branched-chain amino acid transport system substrate-binding protein